MADLTSSQLGERSWLPVVAGSFVFIFASSSAYFELHAPTADINVPPGAFWLSGGSAAGLMASQMAVLTSSQHGFAFISMLEDFSKPLSPSFRLLGAVMSAVFDNIFRFVQVSALLVNIMADELTIAVLSSLVAFIVALVDIFGDDACLQFGGGTLGNP
jgi:F0F1-type ATP synthase membrane subunit a